MVPLGWLVSISHGAPWFLASPNGGQAVTPRRGNDFWRISVEEKAKPVAIELPEGASRVRSRFALFMSTEEAFMNSSASRPTWADARQIRKEVMSHELTESARTRIVPSGEPTRLEQAQCPAEGESYESH